VDTFLSFVNSV